MAVAARQKRRYANAKLTRPQTVAAHQLYLAGMSVPELADAGWQKWGYTGPKQAATALYRAFDSYGLPRRSSSAAAQLAYQRRPGYQETVAQHLRTVDGSGSSLNARKTHCDHGHELAGANLRIDYRGHRRCRTCNREALRDARARKKKAA